MNDLSNDIHRLIGIFSVSYILSILSTLAGIGGGAIFTPLYVLIGNLDIKEAIFISLMTMMGNTLGRIIYYLTKRHHHNSKRFLTNYDLIRLFVPFNSNTTYFGFFLNKVLPGWSIIILIIILMAMVIYTTTKKTIKYWKEMKENKESQEVCEVNLEDLESLENLENNPDIQDLTKTNFGDTYLDLFNQIIYCILPVALVTFFTFMVKEVGWFIYFPQLIIMWLLGYLTMNHVRLMEIRKKEYKGEDGSQFQFLEGDVDWSLRKNQIKVVIGAGITGIASALLGIGGSLIMNPVMLHLHMFPRVMLATSSWITFFSVSSSTLQYVVDDVSIVKWYHWIVFGLGFLASGTGLLILKRLKKNVKFIIACILNATMILCFIFLIIMNVIKILAST